MLGKPHAKAAAREFTLDHDHLSTPAMLEADERGYKERSSFAMAVASGLSLAQRHFDETQRHNQQAN